MNLKEYWNNMQTRERRALIGGTATAILLLFYSIVWAPLSSELAQLRHSVEEQHQVYMWMQQAAQEVRRLKKGKPVSGGQSQSLLAITDSSARKRQLGAALKRIQPDSETGVRVWMEGASFDDVLGWLDDLTELGIQISSVVVERGTGSGLVDARFVLESSQ